MNWNKIFYDNRQFETRVSVPFKTWKYQILLKRFQLIQDQSNFYNDQNIENKIFKLAFNKIYKLFQWVTCLSNCIQKLKIKKKKSISFCKVLKLRYFSLIELTQRKKNKLIYLQLWLHYVSAVTTNDKWLTYLGWFYSLIDQLWNEDEIKLSREA